MTTNDGHRHDLGLAHDIGNFAPRDDSAAGLHVDRRRALLVLGGAGLALGLGAATRVRVTGGGYAATPQETAGPYPGDGSNGPNVLTKSAVVRRDIRSSFGGATAVAAGVPLTIRIRVTDVSDGNVPKPGAAVYLWHCDRDGRYSLYSSGVTDENYLRGVQVANTKGWVTFKSIFPGCYVGRWPHIHYEVYPSLARAAKASNKIATSQIALPAAACKAAYARSAYAASKANLAQVSLTTDNVLSDGWKHELASVTGDNAKGYTATLVMAVG